MTTETRGIGDNQPPPIETYRLHIEDLMENAKHFLDGEPIKDEAGATAVSGLLDMIRKTRKDADASRIVEKRPHDDAAKAVQAAWVPLLEKCDLAASVAKKALTPYLQAKEAEQVAIAAEARRVAQAAQDAALAAQRAAQASDDLEAAERAKEATKAASIAGAQAIRAEKARPQAAGGARAIGLRTSYRAEITDAVAFARWAWEHRRDQLLTALAVIADHEATAPKQIPGLIIHTDRKAA